MKTIEAPEVVAVKIHQGQGSWPAWMEAACVVAVGEMEVPEWVQPWSCTCALWETEGQQFRWFR